MRRRRIWSETLGYDELGSPAVLSLLVRHGLDVLVAVTEPLLPGLGPLLSRLAGAGVGFALWPMLGDGEGRWGSSANMARFLEQADLVLSEARLSGARVPELVLDLEPPFSVAQAASHGSIEGPLRAAAALRRGFAEAVLRLEQRARVLRSELLLTCAAVPVVLFDDQAPGAGRPLYQALLGTPVDGVPFDSVSVMVYTSILEGWSRGLVDRRRALALLAGCALRARSRYGPRASLSLGTVGTGAFADEPIYRDPGELAEDVAISRRAGVDDLVLFDLGGVLRRGPPEAWLEAFVHGEAALDLPRSRRVSLALSSLEALGRWPRRG